MKISARALLLPLALLVCTTAAGARESISVTFAGSSTVMPVMEALQAPLGEKGVDIRIQGGGSSAGLRALRMGMADVAMVSRALSPEELDEFRAVPLAEDIVAVIVNEKNPVESFSRKDIRDIYSGERDRWPTGKAINVIGKESGRATKQVFEQHFDLRGAVRRDAVIIGSNGQAITAVAQDERAIAYVSYADAYQAMSNGEALRIPLLEGVTPGLESAREGRYPLRRRLNLVYLPKSESLVSQVVAALKDDRMKAIMEGHFVLPFPEH